MCPVFYILSSDVLNRLSCAAHEPAEASLKLPVKGLPPNCISCNGTQAARTPAALQRARQRGEDMTAGRARTRATRMSAPTPPTRATRTRAQFKGVPKEGGLNIGHHEGLKF